MELIKDIQINYFNGVQDRIQISGGAEEVDYLNGLKAHPKTYVPKSPWRPITKNEESVLISKSVKKKYTDISVLSLPRKLKKALRKLNFQKSINNSDIYFIQNSIEYRNIVSKLSQHFEVLNNISGEFEIHSIFFGEPNLKNNTFNTNEKVFIGMHLDSWEKKNYIERKEARNRICINLGAEPRYLLFYNISIHTMAEYINLKNNAESLNINEIYKLFAAKYVNYPILKLRINPLEAYLAPTEFIIHDGCNQGTKTPDINLVFRGYYNLDKINFIKKLFINLNLAK